MELTEAGESFYEDARQILAMSDAALEKAKGIARGMNGSLSLGITSSDAFHPQIFTLLHRFQLDHPGVTLHQMEDNMANLMTALSEAELDIAFVRLPCESSKAFNLRIIDEEPMVIALPRDNPLATQPTLALEQLRDVAPILFPREVAPGLYELVYNSCLRARDRYGARLAVVANFVLAEHGQCWLRLRAGSAVDDLHPAAERQLSPA
ncbi:LysR family transcriptional regulator [Klebsiella pneumoniae]|uniref:LysR family transcriptional regulator n=1 Tax=Klebsiella pneumoniae TaxID=573 RepID=A0A4P0Y989_KLEPN|nr:LysR family transcriptional regulator [Klebsiella pneumoniae]